VSFINDIKTTFQQLDLVIEHMGVNFKNVLQMMANPASIALNWKKFMADWNKELADLQDRMVQRAIVMAPEAPKNAPKAPEFKVAMGKKPEGNLVHKDVEKKEKVEKKEQPKFLGLVEFLKEQQLKVFQGEEKDQGIQAQQRVAKASEETNEAIKGVVAQTLSEMVASLRAIESGQLISVLG
jgi:hypothetical protein